MQHSGAMGSGQASLSFWRARRNPSGFGLPWWTSSAETMTSKRMEDSFREHAVELDYAPAVFVSALSGQRLGRLPELLAEVHHAAHRQWGQIELAAVLKSAVERTPPPTPPHGRQEFKGVVQRGVNPIRFAIEVTQPEALPPHYRRYLEHQFRAALGVGPAAIALSFARPRRKRRAPAAGAKP